MGKSGVSRRPKGRNPVIAVRVTAPLHAEIRKDAKAAKQTMSEEMASLLRSALDHRKRFRSSAAAHAVELATIGFVMHGERMGQEKGIEDWTSDVECRRQAALAACTQFLMFVSIDPKEQKTTVDSLQGRVWTDAFQQAQRDREGAS